jgi:hypothetical protein
VKQSHLLNNLREDHIHVGVVYSNRASGEWIRDDQRSTSDAAAKRVGLEAIHHLVAIDAWKVKRQKTNYVPQMPS